MYALLLCALAGNPIALLALAGAFLTERRARRIGIGAASVAIGTLTVLLGVASYVYWMAVVDSALAVVDPSSRDMLLERGREEAMTNVWFGLGGGALPILFGVLALARGIATPHATHGPRGE